MAAPFVLFDVLQGLALLFCLVTYLSALFSNSISRLKTWFSLILSCVVYCISYLLLVGRQDPDSEAPPFALCLFQAGLIYAAPATVATCGLAFVVELYWRISYPLSQATLSNQRIIFLLLIPPLVHSITFWIPIGLGLSNHSLVARDPSGFYCHFTSKIPTIITSTIVVLCIAIATLIELYTTYFLWRRRRHLSDVRANGSNMSFPLALFVRMAIFTLLGGVGILLTNVILKAKRNGEQNDSASLDALAIIPLAVAVVFGSQMDLLRVYMFWRRKKVRQSHELSHDRLSLPPLSYTSSGTTAGLPSPTSQSSIHLSKLGVYEYRSHLEMK